MANEVSFFEILSENSKELSDFYRQVFDWDIIPPAGAMEYRLMDTKSNNRVMGALGDPLVNGESWLTVYVSVDDIDRTLEDVVSHKGRVKVPKYTTDTGFTLAYIEDSHGHVIGIMQK